MVAGPRKGMLDLALKLMSQRLGYFHSQCSLFCSSFLLLPLTSPSPKGQDSSRQCFSWHLLTCPASAVPAGVGARRGTPVQRLTEPGLSSAPWQGRAEAADVQVALLHAGLFQGLHGEAFWVGSDAESCRIIRDERLTLINTFYCQTSHKPHKSL